MKTATPQTWIILGASSAIGREFGRLAARRGADVVLAGRDLADLRRTAADITVSTGRSAIVAAFDALDTEGHAALVENLTAVEGILNVALLFGTMPAQSDMDADPELALD